ncbi:MAG: transcription-repair coupling factor [Gammaproteobacteria bacterium]|nr:transcription-repair coupling factor [Gammaproteobacteria bacterium]
MSDTLLMTDDSMKLPAWGQLYGSSLPLALAEYCQQTAGVKLLITPDNWYAKQLLDEIQFFLQDQPHSQEILVFPDWETLPYDQFSPHQDIISERLATLQRLYHLKDAIVISSVTTLMHRLCPPTFIHQQSLILRCGQSLDIDTFRQQLTHAGYHLVNSVLEHGEFAVRGSIIDLFPMGSNLPFRIELFDSDIESLRRFHPETQRTIDKIDHIDILPAREMPFHEQGISLFRQAFRNQFNGNPSHVPLYEAVSAGQIPAGIEYYLPLFFEQTVSFFDYLPETTHICLIEDIPSCAEQFWQEVNHRFEQRSHDVMRPILAPQQCFLSPIALLTATKRYHRINVSEAPFEHKKAVGNFDLIQPPEFPVERQNAAPLHRLSTWIQDHPEQRYLIVVESAGRRETIQDLLKQSQIQPKFQSSWISFIADTSQINIAIGALAAGAELATVSIIVESQLFGQQSTPQQRKSGKAIDPNTIIRDLAELNVGAPVVHLQFGVGRYLGLQTFVRDGLANEFLSLAYAGEDKIYVPVTALHLISRYTGADPDHAPLHRLGSDLWQKEKKKAAEKIHDVAIELLEIYAKRAEASGHKYSLHQTDYERFASGFPFALTTDQITAIEQISQDMQSSRPMDRLICGDVGFGKTEVAMRAAFIAARDGKQVCVLVPTTLLADQHFESFSDRFADFPITIELLSRFRSEKQAAAVLQGLASGQVDIVIGTHKLFQKSIQFQRLGLLIVDEEHRFGVKQKEHMKAMCTNVDLLCMTATPIPRTLNMAMAGIRDISLIATPPAKRLAIKTFWQERSDPTIIEAILREILRGGQVFFLHNNVRTIEQVTQSLQALVPQAKIRFAHGQMRERALEQIMSEFYHHQFNVLVCTTIIETGIDIPTANTIIIDRADMFGMAQLHQLRGRVGRSHHQAYAYLLTPPDKLLTPDAIKRLEAIVSLEELGAGFTLATHDLEIRGAGELLGEEQSGNMHAIGFNLFMEMLDKAVADLKAGKTPELQAPMQQGPEIDLGISTVIPETYIGDTHLRLIFYKRIAHAQSEQALHDLQVELIDRFGLLPPTVKYLFLMTQVKLLATDIGIQKIQASGIKGKLDFQAEPKINPAKIISLIQTQSERYQMQGPSRFCFKLDATNAEEKIQEITHLLLLIRATS